MNVKRKTYLQPACVSFSELQQGHLPWPHANISSDTNVLQVGDIMALMGTMGTEATEVSWLLSAPLLFSSCVWDLSVCRRCREHLWFWGLSG